MADQWVVDPTLGYITQITPETPAYQVPSGITFTPTGDFYTPGLELIGAGVGNPTVLPIPSQSVQPVQPVQPTQLVPADAQPYATSVLEGWITGKPAPPVPTDLSTLPVQQFAVPGIAAGITGLGAAIGLPGIASTVNSLVAGGQVAKAISAIASFFGKNKVLAVLAALAAAGLITYEVYQLLHKKAPKRHKRYSIGANPRVSTLIKVSKVCDRQTRKMYQRFRHAGLIKIQGRHEYHRTRRH